MHLEHRFTKFSLLFLCLKVKESETDPLINVEKGSGSLPDSVVVKAPSWNSSKDQHV